VVGDSTGFNSGGAGDLNRDGISDLVLGATNASPSVDRLQAGRSFIVYGGISHMASLDRTDGNLDGRIDLSSLDGSQGFVINGITAGDLAGRAIGVGDINGDHLDDIAIGQGAKNPGRAFVVFGRDSTAGQVFPAVFELS
jgi:hypothetical protein